MLRDKAGQSNSKSCLSRPRCESPQFEWFLKRLHKIQPGFRTALQPKLKQILTGALRFLTASSATIHILPTGFRHQTVLTVAPKGGTNHAYEASSSHHRFQHRLWQT